MKKILILLAVSLLISYVTIMSHVALMEYELVDSANFFIKSFQIMAYCFWWIFDCLLACLTGFLIFRIIVKLLAL